MPKAMAKAKMPYMHAYLVKAGYPYTPKAVQKTDMILEIPMKLRKQKNPFR
jgi:hypothetical protein